MMMMMNDSWWFVHVLFLTIFFFQALFCCLVCLYITIWISIGSNASCCCIWNLNFNAVQMFTQDTQPASGYNELPWGIFHNFFFYFCHFSQVHCSAFIDQIRWHDEWAVTNIQIYCYMHSYIHLTAPLPWYAILERCWILCKCVLRRWKGLLLKDNCQQL